MKLPLWSRCTRNVFGSGKRHLPVRLLFIALTFLSLGLARSQSPDGYVKEIEKLRREGKLTAKSSTDKTFVGSVTAYYDKDSLVLINSLADAEASMTETLYYVKNGVVKKVYIMT